MHQISVLREEVDPPCVLIAPSHHVVEPILQDGLVPVHPDVQVDDFDVLVSLLGLADDVGVIRTMHQALDRIDVDFGSAEAQVGASECDVVSACIPSGFGGNLLHDRSLVLLDFKGILEEDVVEAILNPDIVDVGVDDLEESPLELEPVDLATRSLVVDHPEVGVGVVVVECEIFIPFELVVPLPGQVVHSQNFSPGLPIQGAFESDSVEVLRLDAVFLVGHYEFDRPQLHRRRLRQKLDAHVAGLGIRGVSFFPLAIKGQFSIAPRIRKVFEFVVLPLQQVNEVPAILPVAADGDGHFLFVEIQWRHMEPIDVALLVRKLSPLPIHT